MDLGSALMSAEMALEFLPEEQRDKVHRSTTRGGRDRGSEAAGSDIKQVLAEAREALTAKAAIGYSQYTSSVAMNKGQQTKDNRQKKPTDCSQSFRITRPSSGSILRQQPDFSPKSGCGT